MVMTLDTKEAKSLAHNSTVTIYLVKNDWRVLACAK